MWGAGWRYSTDRYRVHSETILAAIRAIARQPGTLSDPEVITALRRLADDKTEGDQVVRAEAMRVLALQEQN